MWNGGVPCAHEPVAVDDMVEMAERMFEAQATFGLEQKPTLVDIGYHYTRNDNLERIQTVRTSMNRCIAF